MPRPRVWEHRSEPATHAARSAKIAATDSTAPSTGSDRCVQTANVCIVRRAGRRQSGEARGVRKQLGPSACSSENHPPRRACSGAPCQRKLQPGTTRPQSRNELSVGTFEARRAAARHFSRCLAAHVQISLAQTRPQTSPLSILSLLGSSRGLVHPGTPAAARVSCVLCPPQSLKKNSRNRTVVAPPSASCTISARHAVASSALRRGRHERVVALERVGEG